jgi:hypothetical protein
MARITLIIPLLLSVAWATVPDSVTYVGPDTVVELSQGSGQYQVGIKDGDTLKGPCRLIVTDTRLYLLDQFNNRVLCFDTAGTFVDQFNTSCDAVDMALDSYSRLYFLDNHHKWVTVVVTETGKEITRFNVKHGKRIVNGFTFYPGDSLVFTINQHVYYRLEYALDSKGRKTRETYCFEQVRYPATYANLIMDFDGEECSGFTLNTEIGRKSSNCLPFLDDVNAECILSWSHSETRYHETDSKIESNSILIFVGNKGCEIITNPPGSYYEIVHWRNVAMDCRGNVYVFDLDQDGKACILKWRPSP